MKYDKLKAAIDNAIEVLENDGDEFGIAENLREALTAQPVQSSIHVSNDEALLNIKIYALGLQNNKRSVVVSEIGEEILELLEALPQSAQPADKQPSLTEVRDAALEEAYKILDEEGHKLQTDDRCADYWEGVGAMVLAGEAAIRALQSQPPTEQVKP